MSTEQAHDARHPESPSSPPGEMLFIEFVAMMAGLMALNALAIDVMLPALSTIAADLGAQGANAQQEVVTVYIMGFGIPQLIMGPLTDRFGRRPVLFVSLVGFVISGLACTIADTFVTLLAWRFLQGVFASGLRVVAASVVRDRYAGRGMARLMSFIMTVFMLVPILAPSIGQLILLIAPWRWTLGVLVVGGAGMFIWTALRLPETLPKEKRTPLSARRITGAYWQVLTTPVTLGYMIAAGTIFGALFAFVASSEQVFRDVYKVGDAFALYFGGVAFAMAMSSLVNARVVEKIGMRRLSHIALCGFTLVSLTLLGALWVFGEHIWIFYPLFALIFGCFGMIGANFTALAMEPLGRIAGTGSAVYGFMTATVAGAIGGFIGSRFTDSSIPIIEGYCGLGIVTLLIVLVTERGKLFRQT